MSKLKFGFYWAASCGGCEVAVLDINEKILDVVAAADILFWPVALDFKYHHVEDMPDKHMDVFFFNGSIRNSEQEEMANLFRRKTKALVAFGACASFGGIPGLGNFTNCKEIMDRAYLSSPSTPNPEKTVPLTRVKTKEGELVLPEVWNTVKSLNQVVPVDYYLPGCPPPPELIVAAVQTIASGKLPPPGAVLAGSKSVCDECDREKNEKKITEFKRYHEINPDPKKCLLEQGIVCCGPATRSGCGYSCVKVNIPCRGCFGPADRIHDQGAKMMSAIASVIDAEDPERAKEIADTMVDPAGTFYRFTLPTSLLKRKNMEVRA